MKKLSLGLIIVLLGIASFYACKKEASMSEISNMQVKINTWLDKQKSIISAAKLTNQSNKLANIDLLKQSLHVDQALSESLNNGEDFFVVPISPKG